MKERDLTVNGWAVLAGVSEGTIRNFLAGGKNGSESLSDRTYALLAASIGSTVAELQGEKPATRTDQGRDPRRAEAPQIPVANFVGAGDEVLSIERDGGRVEYTPSPPGLDKGGAIIVRDERLQPVFHVGDLLFFRHRRNPPAAGKPLPIRPVIVHLKDGRQFVKKLLPGTKAGRFHLLSISPGTPVWQDQNIEGFAPIEWVKPQLA